MRYARNARLRKARQASAAGRYGCERHRHCHENAGSPTWAASWSLTAGALVKALRRPSNVANPETSSSTGELDVHEHKMGDFRGRLRRSRRRPRLRSRRNRRRRGNHAGSAPVALVLNDKQFCACSCSTDGGCGAHGQPHAEGEPAPLWHSTQMRLPSISSHASHVVGLGRMEAGAGSFLTPSPASNLGHIVTIAGDVLLMIEKLVANRLLGVCGRAPSSARDQSRRLPGGSDRDRSARTCRKVWWWCPLPCSRARGCCGDLFAGRSAGESATDSRERRR